MPIYHPTYSPMKITIPSYKSYEYVEVFKITECRDDAIYRTKSIGFAHRDRPKQDDEIYAPLSTTLTTKHDNIELEVMEHAIL